MNTPIVIEQATTFSSSLTESVNTLLHQLNPNAYLLSDKDVQEMLDASTNELFVAKDAEKIIGMITLITYRIPYAKKGILEDFVVDASYRGKGVGSDLIKTAMESAKEKNVKYIELTSNPTREKAREFYLHLGFVQRETNVYRFSLQ